jgi:tRNA A37 threonylcarbamoyladenosine dehydratase
MEREFLENAFTGFKQLVGDDGFARIARASVCVVGLGGVGSWAVEALARSGVGAITLVDLDEVCITNINRQSHALTSTVGRSKAEVLAERITLINPLCSVRAINKFFSESTADDILAPGYSLVLDTIDSADHKTLLLAECVRRGIKVITVGSAGNRLTPDLMRVHDLAKTIHDPLLQIVRRRLRQDFEFPRSERTLFDIPCVYAPQQVGSRHYQPPACSTSPEYTETRSKGKSCNAGLGSAVYVTGAIGFMAAAQAVEFLRQEQPEHPYDWVENKRARLAERA